MPRPDPRPAAPRLARTAPGAPVRTTPAASLALAPRSFDEQLHEQVRKAPWLLASVAIHGVAALIVAMIPPTVHAPVVAQVITAAPYEAPPELAPDPEPEKLPETDQEIDRPASETVADAPPSPKDEVPGIDDEDEPPLGTEQGTDFSPFDAANTNRVIGTGGNAGSMWGTRTGKGRGGPGGPGGGGDPRGTERAVSDALDWLARHQSPDGRWDSDGFDQRCQANRCSGPGDAVHDPGLTGLSLLCFLGRGDTHQSGPYKEQVKSGLRYLKNVQDSEGCFGPRTSPQFQYDHAISTLAMVEAYGMTQSTLFREPAQRGVDFVHRSQNPYLAWRYGVRDGDNDTSVTGWMVMALKSAKMAELTVDDGAVRNAVSFIDRMTDPEFGKVGYQSRGGPSARTTAMQAKFPASNSESLTSVGVLCRIFAGEDPKTSEPVRKGLALMTRQLPRWDIDAGTIDMYYWYYGSLAAFQAGGDAWKQWNGAMKTAIVDHQRHEADRCERGSWDPEDPWAPEGGRIYSTALMTLCLEVYYRYPRVFGMSNER